MIRIKNRFLLQLPVCLLIAFACGLLLLQTAGYAASEDQNSALIDSESVDAFLELSTTHVDLEDEVVVSVLVEGIEDLYAFQWTIEHPSHFELADISLDPAFGAGDASLHYAVNPQSNLISMNGSLTGNASIDASEQPVTVLHMTFQPTGSVGKGTFKLLADGSYTASFDEVLYPISTDAAVEAEAYVAMKSLTLLSDDELILTYGEVYEVAVSYGPAHMTYPELIWEVSDPSVVSLESYEDPWFDQQSGMFIQYALIEAIGSGQTTVTVKSAFGEVMDTISVKAARLEIEGPDSIELSVTEHDEYEQSISLQLVLDPVELADEVIWTSSDESVAVVDENGQVTAVGAGMAVITAYAENGFISDSVTVQVHHFIRWTTSNDKAFYYTGERFTIGLHMEDALTFVTNGDLHMMLGIDLGLVVEDVRLAQGISGQIEVKGYVESGQVLGILATDIDFSNVQAGDPVLYLDVVTTQSGHIPYGISYSMIVDEGDIMYPFLGAQGDERYILVADQDANKDGNFDLLDLVRVSKFFNVRSDSSDYLAELDLNGDGVINIIDISFISLLLLENPVIDPPNPLPIIQL